MTSDNLTMEIAALQSALDTEAGLRLDLQRQLHLAHAEVEEFVSIAVHDIREPLRDVAAFSQILAETSAGRLDSDALECLHRIQHGAAVIQSLLTDVVDYWTASEPAPHPPATDMEAVLCHVLLRLEKQRTQRDASVTHDLLPRVRGEFETLAKLLQHLVANAIQYCAEPAPLVHISARQEDGLWEFAVRDNGPGIEPEYHKRIFLPFQRLHGREYPGHGLGLAFCAKAIEGLGGRIWLESAPGEGSTFFFTVPAA